MLVPDRDDRKALHRWYRVYIILILASLILLYLGVSRFVYCNQIIMVVNIPDYQWEGRGKYGGGDIVPVVPDDKDFVLPAEDVEAATDTYQAFLTDFLARIEAEGVWTPVDTCLDSASSVDAKCTVSAAKCVHTVGATVVDANCDNNHQGIAAPGTACTSQPRSGGGGTCKYVAATDTKALCEAAVDASGTKNCVWKTSVSSRRRVMESVTKEWGQQQAHQDYRQQLAHTTRRRLPAAGGGKGGGTGKGAAAGVVSTSPGEASAMASDGDMLRFDDKTFRPKDSPYYIVWTSTKRIMRWIQYFFLLTLGMIPLVAYEGDCYKSKAFCPTSSKIDQKLLYDPFETVRSVEKELKKVHSELQNVASNRTSEENDSDDTATGQASKLGQPKIPEVPDVRFGE